MFIIVMLIILIVAIFAYIGISVSEKKDNKELVELNRKLSTYSKPPTIAIPETKTVQKPKITVSVTTNEYDFKVVGVTFNNNDGSSRQEYLQQYEYDDCACVTLEEYSYKGDPAIMVLIDGDQVGNVAAKEVEKVLSILEENPDVEIDHSIYCGEDTYGMRVYLRW